MSVFTSKIKLLLVAILVKILYKFKGFKITSFMLGLREITLSSI